jgi:hypothetical protein
MELHGSDFMADDIRLRKIADESGLKFLKK